MYCTKCGSRIPEESEYCTQCGCRLQTESPSEKQKQDQTPPSPKSEPEAIENIPMGILGALLGAVVCIFIILSCKFDDFELYDTTPPEIIGFLLFMGVFGGYYMLGKKISNFSSIFCFAVIFIVPYFAEQLYWIFTYMEDRGISFLKACNYLYTVSSRDGYVSSLLETYYYCCMCPVMLAITFIISLFRKKS